MLGGRWKMVKNNHAGKWEESEIEGASAASWRETRRDRRSCVLDSRNNTRYGRFVVGIVYGHLASNERANDHGAQPSAWNSVSYACADLVLFLIFVFNFIISIFQRSRGGTPPRPFVIIVSLPLFQFPLRLMQSGVSWKSLQLRRHEEHVPVVYVIWNRATSISFSIFSIICVTRKFDFISVILFFTVRKFEWKNTPHEIFE